MEQFAQGPEFSPQYEASTRRIHESVVEAWNGESPAFRVLNTDRTGEVWASEFPLTSSIPTRYRIFASDGTLQGRIEVAPNFYILDIRDGLLLGVERDELDTHAISLYRIER